MPKTICTIEGCGSAVHARGFCNAHYRRWQRGGDPLGVNARHAPKTASVNGKQTPEYSSWCSIRRRCLNPAAEEYGDYGGRGITICERWLKFEHFLADMGLRPSPKHSIDRYPDNNGNYEPTNCRWATMKEQARNTRRTRLLTINGTTKCAADWAAETGMRRETLYSRLDAGVAPERAALAPIRQGRPWYLE